MTRTVQLSIADAVYATALRDLLVHSGPWNVKAVARPDPVLAGVLVVDEPAFLRPKQRARARRVRAEHF